MINSQLIIVRKSHRTVLLKYWNNRSCPIRKIYTLYDASLLQSIQLFVELITQSITERALQNRGSAWGATWIFAVMFRMFPSSSLKTSMCLLRIACKLLLVLFILFKECHSNLMFLSQSILIRLGASPATIRSCSFSF